MIRKIVRHLVILLVLVPAITGAIENARDAIATPDYMKHMRVMTIMGKIDTNGDHVVSREEGEAYYRKLFKILDKNHDGVLDAREWFGAREDAEMVSLSSGGYVRALSSQDMHDICDADHDGVISEGEFLKAHEKIFDKMVGGQASAIDVQHWLSDYFPK